MLNLPEARAEGNTAGELTVGRELVQRFQADDDNLQTLSLRVDTLGRVNHCFLHTKIAQIADGRTIYEHYTPCEQLKDQQDLTLTFEPVAHSKNQTYLLIVGSPDAKTPNAVTVELTRNPIAIEAKNDDLTIDGQLTPATLVFAVGYRYSLGVGSKLLQTILLTGLLGILLAGTGLIYLWKRQDLLSKSVTTSGQSHRAAYFQTTVAFVVRHRWSLIMLICIYVLYMLAVPYYSFSDEYDNILGGININHLRLPNTGFFTHHLPLPYFTAALLTSFTGSDVWLLRTFWLFLLFLWSLINYHLIYVYVDQKWAWLFPALLALTMPIYLGHLLLGETLIAYAVVTLTLLFLYKYLTPTYVIKDQDALAVAVLTAVITLSSLGYIFAALWSYAVFGFVVLRQLYRTEASLKSRLGTLSRFGLYAGLPYLLVALWLVLSRGTGQFVAEVYDFNRDYYSQFTTIRNNPLISLGQIIVNFWQAGLAAMSSVFDPGNQGIFLGLLALLSLFGGWIYRHQLKRVAFFGPFVILLNPREGLGAVWTGNFHATPFVVIVLLVACLSLIETWPYLRHSVGLKLLHYGLAASLLVTTLAAISFSFNVYFSYLTTNANTIAAEPTATAKTLNNLTSSQDYIWIGPFDFQTWLDVKARPASHYEFVLPWVEVCDSCKNSLLNDLMQTRPKIIYWQNGANFFNQPMDYYSGELISFIHQNYFVVDDSKGQRLKNFYFRKENQTAIMTELKAKNYLP